MSLSILALLFFIILFFSYRVYGNFVAKQFSLNDKNITPSEKFYDGVDFVPTNKFYLFAQHFSSISAAGPIAGPIIACLLWGWLPCLIWICMGVVFVGAVHDFSSLIASVRHEGTSIAHIAQKRLGNNAGIAMMIFIWFALIYVITAFTEITASSFVGISEEFSNVDATFNTGGAVAFSAILYLLLSISLGLIEKYLKPKLWLITIIYVPLAFACIWLGTYYSHLLIFDLKDWCFFILAYCFVASLLPVWLLLQPRGYLGGFFLYTVIALGIYGILFGNYEIKQDAFKGWNTLSETDSLFPFLFVTIACGACSGFHGLVCSGTTSKQIEKESHTYSIGYGAMLCEALVAVIALMSVMIWSSDEITGLKPGSIYGKSIGEFLCLIIGKNYLPFAITFGAMAFSTFVFDTLDVSTRLGRYLLEEIFNLKTIWGKMFATLITVLFPMLFVYLSKDGNYMQFWTLFGASNQLLAALTLLTITIWLYESNRKIIFTLVPMLFVLCTTLWALIKHASSELQKEIAFNASTLNSLIAILLIVLSVYLVGTSIMKIFKEKNGKISLEERSIIDN